ncbi:MAG: autotransporter domain-containing protein [bacterium]|nr:autotransporter domain-containing protein [bacterium]
MNETSEVYVYGSLISPLSTFNLGSLLAGNGTVTGDLIMGGTIAPGNSIGTLSINGNYTQGNGSTYAIEINPAGQSDAINVICKATIAEGTTAKVIRQPGIYTPGTQYTVLTVDGGLSGKYPTLTQTISPFLDLLLSYDANHTYLSVRMNKKNLVSFAQTSNQLATAIAANNLHSGNNVYDALINLPNGSDIRKALDGLSGQFYASSLNVFLEESRYIREAISNRMHYSFASNNSSLSNINKSQQLMTTASGTSFWTQGLGTWGKLKGNSNAASLSRSSKGIFLGADKTIENNIRSGVLTGFSHSTMNSSSLMSTLESTNYHLGGYAGTMLNHFNLLAAGSYTWHAVDGQRSVQFTNFNNYLQTEYHAGSGQGFIEVGYPLSKKTGLEPFARAGYVQVDMSRFTETGGAAALTGKGEQDTTFSILGLRHDALLFSKEKKHIIEQPGIRLIIILTPNKHDPLPLMLSHIIP